MKKHLLNSHTKYANSMEVFLFETRVHYPEEIKWKVIEMKRMDIQSDNYGEAWN